MLLGALIKQAMRAQGPFAEALGAHDAALAARIDSEAARLGLDRRELVAETVRRFMASEDGESWATIVSSVQRADDPGMAFLEAVLRMRLQHQCSH